MKKVKTSIRLPEDQLEFLDSLNISRSEAIRRAIAIYYRRVQEVRRLTDVKKGSTS